MPDEETLERPAAPRHEPRGVLFVDVSDSTRLLRTLGDARGREVLLACLAVLQEAVEAAGATVVDRIGNELFCTCASPAATIALALDLQAAVADARLAGRLPEGLDVRIGLHHGPVILERARVFGETVHLAKRVAALAKPQQILTTGETLAQLAPDERPEARLVDSTHVKGRAELVELYEVLWGLDVTRPQPGRPAPARPADAQELALRSGADELVVGLERPTLTVGRGRQCDVVVPDSEVSRLHARVERRKSGFALVDLSTNGTHLVPDGEPARFVHRDEAPLTGTGRIVLGALGALGASSQAPWLSFEVRARRSEG